MKYYDTHCHIDLGKNTKEIIEEIENEKIYVIAMTNLPVLFDRLNNDIKSKYIRISLGFHPELIYEYKHLLTKMWEFLDKTRYIGEVGLDFNKNTSVENKEIQIKFFTELLHRCNISGGKILSIHSRGAEKELESILENNYNNILIFHWYTGGITVMNKLINKGFYFSVNHSMTKIKSGQKIIENIPLDKILLETDFPFTKTLDSEYKKIILDEIILEISNIKKININLLKNKLFDNFRQMVKSNH